MTSLIVHAQFWTPVAYLPLFKVVGRETHDVDSTRAYEQKRVQFSWGTKWCGTSGISSQMTYTSSVCILLTCADVWAY